MALRNLTRSTISGSLATLRSTLVPAANDAAITAFSVPPTVTVSKVKSTPFKPSGALARDADDDLDSVIAQWNEAVIEQAEELTGD